MTTAKLDKTLVGMVAHFEGVQWSKLIAAVDVAIAAGIDEWGIADTDELFEAMHGFRPIFDVLPEEAITPASPVEQWIEYVQRVALRYRSLYRSSPHHSERMVSADEIAYRYWDRLLACGGFRGHDALEICDAWMFHVDNRIASNYYWGLQNALLYYVAVRLRRALCS